MIQKYPEFIYNKSSTCPLALTGLKWPLSRRLTRHVSSLRVPILHPQGVCLPLSFSKVSRFLWARGVLEAVSLLKGLWDSDTKPGQALPLGPLPHELNRSGWAVPSRMSPSPKNKPADWRVSWAHWLFFPLSPYVSHSFPNWGSGAVTVHLLPIKIKPRWDDWSLTSMNDDW